MVLIKDNVLRGCWKVGKVVSLVSSLDDCVRSANVSLSSGRVIARPLNLLYPLEVCGVQVNQLKAMRSNRQYLQKRKQQNKERLELLLNMLRRK